MKSILAAVLMLCLLVSPFARSLSETLREAEPLGNVPAYPGEDQKKFSAWDDYLREMRKTEIPGKPELNLFFAKIAAETLREGENTVVSPVNVYLALSLLSQLTGGETQEQILSLLGSGSAEDTLLQAERLLKAVSFSDGATSCLPAASLWLNDTGKWKLPVLDTAAQRLRASSYAVKMGSEETDRLFRQWLNMSTGGLLSSQAGGLSLPGNTALALAETLYFRSRWSDTFSESETYNEVFRAAGGNSTVPFMHRTRTDIVYYGNNFSAMELTMETLGSMLFILPAEGVTAEELAGDTELYDFLFSPRFRWKNSETARVNLSLPKFDVVSSLEMKDMLQALGLTDVFSPDRADFTPLSDEKEIYASSVHHDARVKINEEGCEAAAYTVMMMAGAVKPPEKIIDFRLDRPFLFVIEGEQELPLFIGKVNSIR